MFEKFDAVSFVFGFVFAVPMIWLLQALSPQMKSAIVSGVGVWFLLIGVVFKFSIGVLYRKSYREESPGGYWFNMGTYAGFVVLAWVV